MLDVGIVVVSAQNKKSWLIPAVADTGDGRLDADLMCVVIYKFAAEASRRQDALLCFGDQLLTVGNSDRLNQEKN